MLFPKQNEIQRKAANNYESVENLKKFAKRSRNENELENNLAHKNTQDN